MKINFRKMDKKWQRKWSKSKIFEANVDEKRKKFFTSIIIPYVNANMHIGHSFTYTRTDAYARFKRMQGFNTLLAEGFHATGEPILGTVERLRNNDQNQIETLKLYGATNKDLEDFKKGGPEYVAKYWMKRIKETMKQMGFSVDWRRTFITAIDPSFSRFIEWQYNTLRKKNYVVQGTHPVIWCPKDQSPTGDHDRLKGEGESPIEYTIVKFKLDSGEIIPCATLRPETVYGVTNIWVNPEGRYVGAKVDKETWIVGEKIVEKLKDQLHDVKIISKITAEDLIGRFAINPVNQEKIIILPASLVDPNTGTGIVMSVPAHAPYDWIGLKDLQHNKDEIRKYGLDETEVKNIKPIGLINVEGFGEFPAVDICDKMSIANQKEVEKLDKATNELYKKEFHTGVLRDLYGDLAGKRVSEVKGQMIEKFAEKKIFESIWEMTAPVVCRCTTPCYVKILENQWFLKFSDEEWKDSVRYAIKEMKFYPEIARQQFLNTVDWLNDKACARKSGLGTRLPWDKSWIVETLGDSTIYMAYYTIARVINEKKITAEKLKDEVFDFIFLEKGNSKDVAEKSKLNEKVLKEMKEEFEYFYPVDIRNSGKDLVQNHLTFYLFHHVAIFAEKFWPKAISVNGFVNVSGTKMSKSKGNIIPLKDLMDAIGSDLVRINIAASNEGLDDADWRDESVASYKARLQFLFTLVREMKKARRNSMLTIDNYLNSRMQEHIKNVTVFYEEMKFRSAVQSGLFNATNDIKWYIERLGGIKNCNKKVLKEAVSTVVKLLAPLTPHICEEMWSKIGKGFVSAAAWPCYDEKIVDKNAVELEGIFVRVVEDLRNVLKIVGKKNNAYLYVVTDKELRHLEDGKEFIRKQLGFKKVAMFKTSDSKKYDPQGKTAKAKYGKPGIFLE